LIEFVEFDSTGQPLIKGFYPADFNNMTSWEFLGPKWTKKQTKTKTEGVGVSVGSTWC